MGAAAAGNRRVPARGWAIACPWNTGSRQSAGTRARVGSRKLPQAGCGAIFVRDEASRIMAGENFQCVA